MHEATMWTKLDSCGNEGTDVFEALKNDWLTCRLPWSSDADNGMPLKQCSRDAWDNDIQVSYDDCSLIEISVDGGCSNTESHAYPYTWAFVVRRLSVDGDGCVVSASGGHMPRGDFSSKLFCGEFTHSLFGPELYAQIMARMYILQNKFSKYIAPMGTPICIRYDNISAAECARGFAKSDSCSQLCRLSMLLNNLIIRNGIPVTGEHVKAHEGDPWNKVVDSMCTWFYTKEFILNEIPFGPITENKIIKLELCVSLGNDIVASALGIHCSLPSDYKFDFQVACPPEIIAKRLDDSGCIEPGDGNSISPCVASEVQVVQYNVQTLCDTTKRDDIMTCMRKHKVHIDCLQECRAKKSGVKEVGGFVCCASAANKGNHGCEVWINLSTKFASFHGRPVLMQPELVIVVSCSHRWIIVRCVCKHFDFFIISAHAPYWGCSEDVGEWWKSFEDTSFRICGTSSNTIVGIDANCQLYCHGAASSCCVNYRLNRKFPLPIMRCL